MRGFYRRRVLPAWHAFADAVGSFLEELAFRVVLAFEVLTGKKPHERRRRYWNRACEAPVLIDVYDWTDERFIFSVLVWPVLESDQREAPYAHERRTREVKEAFGRVCADLAWSTRFDTDYGLRWDHEREVWTDSEGYPYAGERFFDYSRSNGEKPGAA